VRKFLPLVLALVIMAPLSMIPSAVQGFSNAVVTTEPATKVGVTDATLNGVVDMGACCSVEVYFQYGEEPNALDMSTDPIVFSDGCPLDRKGTVSHSFSAHVTNLRPCATYYARAVYIGCAASLPGNKIVAGLGVDPVTLPSMLNVAVNLNPVITFTTLCPPTNNSHGSAGYGVTMGSTIRPFLPPMFEIPSATVSATKASPGEQVEVTATITNKGGSNGTTKVILYVNGQEADSKGIALASGQSTPVSFKVSRNDPGTYQVYVNGTSAGSFTVDLFNSNDMLIYASVALFVISMIGLLYYLMKRRTTA